MAPKISYLGLENQNLVKPVYSGHLEGKYFCPLQTGVLINSVRLAVD